MGFDIKTLECNEKSLVSFACLETGAACKKFLVVYFKFQGVCEVLLETLFYPNLKCATVITDVHSLLNKRFAKRRNTYI